MESGGNGRSSCTYLSKNATDVVHMITKDGGGGGGNIPSGAEIIIVDPPRKGLDEAVLEWLVMDDDDDARPSSTPKPQLIVYVSCGFNAFKRDCDILRNSCKWRLDHAEGHLLFPGSDAIETLAFFRWVV